jgi:hypothetical protein
VYSSSISSPLVSQTETYEGFLVCEVPRPLGCVDFNTMELYPVDYWYEHNVDGFGKPYYSEWDVFWFVGTLEGWSV